MILEGLWEVFMKQVGLLNMQVLVYDNSRDGNLNRDAAIFTTSKNTDAVFLAKSVKKWVYFCQFQFEVYNWQYFILHWQNYTYSTVIFKVHCHFHTPEILYDCQK